MTWLLCVFLFFEEFTFTILLLIPSINFIKYIKLCAYMLLIMFLIALRKGSFFEFSFRCLVTAAIRPRHYINRVICLGKKVWLPHFFWVWLLTFHIFSPYCKCTVTNMWSRLLVGLLWIISSVSVVRISSEIMRCVKSSISATLILYFTICNGCFLYAVLCFYLLVHCSDWLCFSYRLS